MEKSIVHLPIIDLLIEEVKNPPYDRFDYFISNSCHICINYITKQKNNFKDSSERAIDPWWELNRDTYNEQQLAGSFVLGVLVSMECILVLKEEEIIKYKKNLIDWIKLLKMYLNNSLSMIKPLDEQDSSHPYKPMITAISQDQWKEAKESLVQAMDQLLSLAETARKNGM